MLKGHPLPILDGGKPRQQGVEHVAFYVQRDCDLMANARLDHLSLTAARWYMLTCTLCIVVDHDSAARIHISAIVPNIQSAADRIVS